VRNIFRIHFNAPTTLSFALLSLLVLGLDSLTNGSSTPLLFAVYRAPFSDPLMYPRLFFHVLGHANMSHYFNNMLIILLVGPMLEEKYGGQRLAFMMTITALVTGVIFLIFSPHAMMLGASGIVFMMILLGSYTNLQRGRVPLTLLLVLVVFLGREIIAGVTIDDNIANLAHIVGGICGAVFGFIVNRNRLG